MKRALLASTIALISIETTLAAPLMPMDARGLAMGNTGVASAKLAHAPAYNPSLLSQARANDDFALLLPQIGVQLADQDGMIDEVDYISNSLIKSFEFDIDSLDYDINNLGNDLTNINPNDLDNIISTSGRLSNSTTDLNKSFNTISGNPLHANLGLASTIAIPSKSFAAAISMNASANVSARLNYQDNSTIEKYAADAADFSQYASQLKDALIANDSSDISTAAQNLENSIDNWNNNPILNSTAEFVAIATVDIGISFAREFHIGSEKIAIGITPKLQQISTFYFEDKVDGFDEVNEDVLKNSQQDYIHFNLDIGASYRFGEAGNWMIGLVGKNLLGGNFDYVNIVGEVEGSVSLNPQFRGGIAYQSKWFNAAFDLDLIENDPIAFEAPTQFAAIGIELDVFNTLQLRAGFRTNLVANNTNIASVGLGFSPFGVHIDIAAMANIDKPETEAGVALETGFYF